MIWGCGSGHDWLPGFVPTTDWEHHAIVFDGEITKWYRNAEPAEKVRTKGYKSKDTRFKVSIPFRGVIDDIRVFDRALSAEEVKKLVKLGAVNE